MLRTVLTLLIGLGSAVSQGPVPYQQSSPGYPPPSDYPKYSTGGQYGGGGSESSIIEEIRKLYNNITSLQLDDDFLIHFLNPMLDESEPNNVLMDNFFSRLFPEVRARQNAQNEEIRDLWTQINDLQLFADDVAEVATSVSESEYQLKEIDAQSKEIQEIVAELQKGDTDQGKKLEAVKNQLAAQETKLTAIEALMAEESERLSYLRDLVETSNEIVQDERESGSYSITLTNEQPIAYQTVPYKGKRAPVAQYGVSSLHVVNDKESIIVPVPYSDYGSKSYGKTPATVPVDISYDLDAYYDPGTGHLTATMFDHSSGGWYIEKLVMSILLFNIDDRILDVEKQTTEKKY